jgi:hypothetical protein
MATQAIKIETKTNEAKAKKPAVNLVEQMKTRLNSEALKNKLTLHDLSDLEQHVKKLAGFLGAA